MYGVFHNNQAFDLELLLFPGIVLLLSLFMLGYLGSRSVLIAAVIAIIKTSLFMFYFGYVFDGTYTSVDDEYYLSTGQQLYQLLLEGGDKLSMHNIHAIVGGVHIAYNFLNVTGFMLFGEYYFSPIVLNIIISALAAVISVAIAKQQKLLRKEELKYFFFFFCLHPEILSWSTVFNGKDTLVLFMNILLLYSVSLFLVKKYKAGFFIGIFTVFILFNLRFYVPFLFGLSFLIFILFSKKISLNVILLFGLMLSMFLAFIVPWNYLSYSFDVYKNSFINPLTGAIHFLLTPRPFFADEIHGFLNYASVFNWILMPIFIMGAYVCYKSRNKFVYFLIIYFSIFVLFYGGFYDLNGPRHRLQLLFVISIFQFVGLKVFLSQMLLQKKKYDDVP